MSLANHSVLQNQSTNARFTASMIEVAPSRKLVQGYVWRVNCNSRLSVAALKTKRNSSNKPLSSRMAQYTSQYDCTKAAHSEKNRLSFPLIDKRCWLLFVNSYSTDASKRFFIKRWIKYLYAFLVPLQHGHEQHNNQGSQPHQHSL